MCPLCIGTTALLVSGGTSAGGLTALILVRRVRGQGSRLIGGVRDLGKRRRAASPDSGTTRETAAASRAER